MQCSRCPAQAVVLAEDPENESDGENVCAEDIITMLECARDNGYEPKLIVTLL